MFYIVPNMSSDDKSREANIAESFRNELISLNSSIIEQVTDIVSKNEPASDLWPQLRKVNFDYKAKRSKILEPEKPKPEPVSPQAMAKPSQQDDFKHRILEEDVSIVWPLSPQLQSSLQIPATAEKVTIQGEPASTLRLALEDLLTQGNVLYQYFQRAVVRISPDTVVKINKSQDTTEVHILDHIRKHTQELPVPTPLGMIRIGKWAYTFTSFIPGISLDSVWSNLSLDKKCHVREQLNHHFAELRRLPIPSEEGYLGGGLPLICKGGHRFRKESSTPIANNAQFNDFLLDDSCMEQARLDYVRGCMPSDHRIVMTHGDLCPLNILVESEDVLTITGIVDWETGGAYPEYWEYVNAFRSSFIDRSDWCLYLPEFGIGKFFDEYARDHVIERFATS
ncbi:kinase-like protein [Dothidotthia symphoricarpi CBS 119687]|uniref:Kinase-like protein n=1 Tax=Dothidotthia symphoricarpi CBS 119687 TaxID=1392245 RepID=A0A6A6AHE0_9PLEO|nr:kinase-like protein [Dothidotthia symphoricarpi CBS 119687]KAF2129861.1 kinase-like protein [Dothidotthia symphoricarpi CBS 119687]